MAFAKIFLMGNLGGDPEIFNYGPDNNKRKGAKFSVAVSTGKGEDKKTDWFTCSAFGNLAKVATEYLAKGRAVIVLGRLTLRTYDSNGKSGASLEVNVDDIQFVPDGKDHSAGGEAPRAAAAPPARSGRNSAPPPVEAEEIPF